MQTLLILIVILILCLQYRIVIKDLSFQQMHLIHLLRNQVSIAWILFGVDLPHLSPLVRTSL
jgi:hypothetical protein